MGYAISMVVAAVIVGLGLWPPSTHGPRATPWFVLGTVSSELPVPMLVLVLAPTALAVSEGDLRSVVGKLALVLAAVTTVAIAWSVVLAARSTTVLGTALRAELGPDVTPDPRMDPVTALRVALAPLWWWRRDVERLTGVRYAPGPGDAHLLDLYRLRSATRPGPALVHLHGGGFVSGARSREARLLLERLARRGWVCVSADYRLRPAQFPDPLVDAKRVIAWLRTEGDRYGVDPTTVVVVGGSAGGHLAAMCALTGDDPRFQPGFEEVGTRVDGAVVLYGYLGPVSDGPLPSSPADYLTAGAPPIMLVHGARDPMAPAADARAFAAALRAVSRRPVVWAQLPGGLHTFDRFASVRSAGTAAAVEAFVTHVRAGAQPGRPAGDGRLSGRRGPARSGRRPRLRPAP